MNREQWSHIERMLAEINVGGVATCFWGWQGLWVSFAVMYYINLSVSRLEK